MARLQVLKNTVREKFQRFGKVDENDRKFIVASMMVNFGIAKRLAQEELEAVITWMDQTESWRQTTLGVELKSTE